MSIDLTYGSLRRMRAEERHAAERLIDRQAFTDDDKQLIHAMLFGPVSAPKHAPNQPDKQYGDWCAIHDQRRIKREVGSRYRCTACDRDYMRRRRAKEGS